MILKLIICIEKIINTVIVGNMVCQNIMNSNLPNNKINTIKHICRRNIKEIGPAGSIAKHNGYIASLFSYMLIALSFRFIYIPKD